MGLLFFATVALGQTGTSTEPSPGVIFSSPGLKQVTLNVCNDAGCSEVTREVLVLDPNPKITSIGTVPSVVGSGQTVTFSGQAMGRPALLYRWLLTSSGGNVELAGSPAAWNTGGAALGAYEVRLEVRNADGVVVSAPVPLSLVRMTFADVPPDHWAWRNIEGIFDQGITGGCAVAPLRYCPANKVTRAEMAVFLVRAIHGAGSTPPAPTGLFTDVATTYWAAPHIEQFYLDGITSGCSLSPLRFCPDSLLTRAEMAVFLLRAKNGSTYVPPPPSGTLFDDVPATHWAAAWIEQLHAQGITTGCATNPLRFCPGDNVDRAQMAAFLTRTFNIPLP